MTIYPDLPCNNVRTLAVGEEVFIGDLLYRTLEQKWEPVSFRGHKVLADEVGFILRSVVVPPKGSRLLSLNETIASGDLFFDYNFSQNWIPVSGSIRQKVQLKSYGNFARFISVEALDKALTLGINPKDLVAAAKPDLYLVPPALVIWAALLPFRNARSGAEKVTQICDPIPSLED